MRTRTTLVAALVAAGLLTAAGAGGAPATPEPRLAGAHPCPDAAGFTCSTLAVPLDRAGRVKGTLDLNVAAADNSDAERGVLLFLTGGPGQPGVPAVGPLVARLGPLMSAYRLVVIDQRGTGGTAIRCPRLQAEIGSSDIATPTAAAVQDCAAKLGVSRGFYSTRDTVADLDDLRQALGVPTWTIDGGSYGAFVAERYALAHPHAVKALVLDSVVPHSDPQAEHALYLVGLRATARVLRAACADSSCGFDPAADLAWLVRHGIAAVPLWNAIVTYEFVDPEYRKALVALHQARHGNPSALTRLIAETRPGGQGQPELYSSGLHAATICGDFRFPWASNTPPPRRAALLSRRLSAFPDSAFWPFTRATAAGNGIVKTCLAWPTTPPAPAPPLNTKLPPVPVLIVNGDHDLSTPLEWAREEARLAPHAKLVVVHGAAHSIQSRERGDAGRAAIEAFLLDPATGSA